MPMYIFGYGSLLNKESRQRTFVELELVEDVVLFGYQRILNATHDSYDFLAMNLTPNETMSVKGHVFAVSESDFEALQQREIGYDLLDISNKISVQLDQPVFAFVMHEPVCAGKCIKRSYLDTCLGGVPDHEHDAWLTETIIQHEIDAEK